MADITELQPVSRVKTFHTFSDSHHLQTAIEDEKDPLSVTLPVNKTKSEVTCFCVSLYLSVFHYEMHECICYQVHHVRLWQHIPSCTHPAAYENNTLTMHSCGPKPNFVFKLCDTV
jgi:hypothetical protein